jgi:CDGSH-type Zn-finger protein
MSEKNKNSETKGNVYIKITKGGPYIITGNVPLKKEIVIIGKEGEPESYMDGEKYKVEETYALCRCGQSKNKPFCDGTHAQKMFDGEESASTKIYLEQAEKITGPDLDLTDAQDFCSAGRFCHRGGGTWSLVEKSQDPKAKKIAIESACNCPSGRLVAFDKKTGKPIENKYVPSISLIEDPQAKSSGPIWVKGGISIESSKGKLYEKRNRITLCRCGQSRNKPYCDGSHIKARFNDGDKSLK